MPKKYKLNSEDLSQEERLTQFFLKSVGASVGIYNAGTDEYKTDEPLYKTNVDIFRSALRDGWTYDELHSLIGMNFRDKVSTALASDIITKKEIPLREGDNLLISTQKYYHPALFNTTAGRWAVGPNTMVPVTRAASVQKDSFTLRDLVDYYYKIVKTGSSSRRREGDSKTMVYLLNQASLDEILFAIDAAGETNEEIRVIELNRFFDDASRDLEYHKSRGE